MVPEFFEAVVGETVDVICRKAEFTPEISDNSLESFTYNCYSADLIEIKS